MTAIRCNLVKCLCMLLVSLCPQLLRTTLSMFHSTFQRPQIMQPPSSCHYNTNQYSTGSVAPESTATGDCWRYNRVVLAQGRPYHSELVLGKQKTLLRHIMARKSYAMEQRSVQLFNGPSIRRKATCNTLFALSLIDLLVGSLAGNIFTTFSGPVTWKMGFGAIPSDTVIPFRVSGSTGLIFTVILANAPQGFSSSSI